MNRKGLAISPIGSSFIGFFLRYTYPSVFSSLGFRSLMPTVSSGPGGPRVRPGSKENGGLAKPGYGPNDFFPGAAAEYYSKSAGGKWIGCIIKEVQPDGSLILNYPDGTILKEGADPSQVRRVCDHFCPTLRIFRCFAHLSIKSFLCPWGRVSTRANTQFSGQILETNFVFISQFSFPLSSDPQQGPPRPDGAQGQSQAAAFQRAGQSAG